MSHPQAVSHEQSTPQSRAQAYPQMVRVRQIFPRPRVEDIPAAVRRELLGAGIRERIRPGESVAITVGSRGVANISTITRAVVDVLKELGAEPFIVPAMGSHGGATGGGQVEVLAHYGITPATVGAPIRSSMEVVEVGLTPDGLTVYADRNAAAANHVLVMNRIKPHTDFFGQIESGLHKIMTIGLGKHKGAQYYHQAAVQLGLERVVRTVGQTVLQVLPVICGLGIIENGYDETARIVAIRPEEMERREADLLAEASGLMARLPFREVDVLIVDEIGKNISGTGMDTNVVGRLMNLYSPEPEWPKIKRIIVRDLTPETAGNALGIGMADFCHRRIIEKIDFHTMYTNAITGLVPEKARLPIYLPSDRECVDLALKTIGLIPPEEARVIHIRSTLHLGVVEVSRAYLEEARTRLDLKVLSDPREMAFDAEGTLVPLEVDGGELETETEGR